MENFSFVDFMFNAFIAMSPVILGALGWLAKLGAQLIAKKIKNEKIASILTRFDYLALSVVKKVMQTYVEDIRAASADGKLTDEEKKAAKDKAMLEVKSHLGLKGLEELAGVFGAGDLLNSIIDTKIEATVHDLKAPVKVESTGNPT